MQYVWACTDFDSETQTCLADGWVQASTWVDYLPTVDQAAVVGGAMFLAVMSVLAVGLLIPGRETEPE